jgi:hypothetical protein
MLVEEKGWKSSKDEETGESLTLNFPLAGGERMLPGDG